MRCTGNGMWGNAVSYVRVRWRAASLTVIAVCLLQPAFGDEGAKLSNEEELAADEARIEDIVYVTSTKRETSLYDTAGSIFAMGAGDIDRTQSCENG